MKKRTLNTKLSLKKVTVVALGGSKEGQVFGGIIQTEKCNTMVPALCQTNNCGQTKVDTCSTYIIGCPSYRKECQNTYFC